MSLVSVFDLDYQAGSKPLFSELSLHINLGDRIGLVGHRLRKLIRDPARR